jgi:hypothetical protein
MKLYPDSAPVQCPACGGSAETIGRRGDETLHRCRECLLEFDVLDSARIRLTNEGGDPTVAKTRSLPSTAPRLEEQGQAVCPHCGSSNLHELPLYATPGYWQTACSDCRLHIKFSAAEWTLARASEIEMPFGKHRGRKVGELAKTGNGRSYLLWVATTVPGYARTAARIVMGLDLADTPDVPKHRHPGGGDHEHQA